MKEIELFNDKYNSLDIEKTDDEFIVFDKPENIYLTVKTDDNKEIYLVTGKIIDKNVSCKGNNLIQVLEKCFSKYGLNPK